MPTRCQPWKSLPVRSFTGPARPYVPGGTKAVARNLCQGACKTFLVGLLVALTTFTASRSGAAEREADTQRQAQQLVDAFREQLGISAVVEVTLVDRDPRVVSVRSRRDGTGAFALSVERDFAARVSDAQLRAALAHELGHVWIATHHPYLQTEQLANRVAMRVVSRDQLVEVYHALWGAEALHGSMETFLGLQAKAEQ